MKLHCTTYTLDDDRFSEFTSSGDGASKVRTRIKRVAKENGQTLHALNSTEVEVGTTRTELIDFLNSRMAHPSHAAVTAE